MEKKKEYDVTVAGYIGVDLAPDLADLCIEGSLSDILKPGKLIEVKDLTISLGGVVANTGLALKIFNKKVLLMGFIGDDRLGDTVLSILREEGLSDGIKRTKTAGTSYGFVIAPPGVDRIFLESPGCNSTFASSDIDYDAVLKSRLFHFGYPPLMKRFFENDGKELEKMFSRVKDLGVVTSLDMTLPDPASESGKIDWKSILQRVLPYVDIFVPSIEEILTMMAPDEYRSLVSASMNGDIVEAVPDGLFRDLGGRIIDLGVKILLIKSGSRGAYLRTGNAGKLNSASGLALSEDHWNNCEMWFPAFRAEPDKIKNASGAGDVAAAGFLAAIINGENADMAGKYAMLAGRNNLYGMDSLEGLTDWETMTEEIVSEAG